MKKDLSTLEIRQLVGEFQFLVNGRVDKIYQTSKKQFVFKIHPAGGSRFLKTMDRFIFIAPEKGETPDAPSAFCMVLRKNLENRRIRKIFQKGSERIAVFETDSAILVVELFGQTNLILCNEKYEVISAARMDKELKKGAKYSFPEKTNIFTLNERQFLDIISSSKTEIVKTVAQLVGGTYSEEICLRAGIPKNATAIEEKEAKKIFSEFVALMESEPCPTVVFEKEPIDAVLYDLKLYEGRNKVLFSAFYEALESYISQSSEIREESQAEKKYRQQIEKVEKIIEVQQKAIEKLSKEAEQSQRAGELIYEHYQEVESVLNDAKKGKESKKIKSTDKKNREITIEI